MSHNIQEENMPQVRREEAKQIEQERRQKGKEATKSAYISAPWYFLSANIVHNCSAELSLLCFVSYNLKSETSQSREKTINMTTVAFLDLHKLLGRKKRKKKTSEFN